VRAPHVRRGAVLRGAPAAFVAASASPDVAARVLAKSLQDIGAGR
jgi:hypothetical protein